MKSKITTVDLNKRYKSMAIKAKKKSFLERLKDKIDESETTLDNSKPTAYVLEFNGSINAKEVESLRDEVSAIIMSEKTPENVNVLVKLDSPGGTVTGYGLVSQQLSRLKERGFDITVVVDQVAASGGYMAAVVSNKIVVAPNAVIGSIGVVCNIPIVEQMLDNLGVDYKEYTAGKYKRTVTSYRQPDEESEQHLNDQLARIHTFFKDHITKHRPDVDMEVLGTGEVWSGYEAVENGLADEIGIYDDIIMEWITKYQVLKVSKKADMKGFIGKFTTSLVESIGTKLQESTSIHNKFQ